MATTVRNIRAEFLFLFPNFNDVGNATEKELLVWEKLVAFWEKLNHLGNRNMDTIPPETVPDVDATVELTREECTSLRTEMKDLQWDIARILHLA